MARREQTIAVLQGGGALGTCQGGDFAALAASDTQPDRVEGISVGTIKATLICGNAAEKPHRAPVRLSGRPAQALGDSGLRRKHRPYSSRTRLTTKRPGRATGMENNRAAEAQVNAAVTSVVNARGTVHVPVSNPGINILHLLLNIAWLLAAFPTNALTGRSLHVSHG